MAFTHTGIVVEMWTSSAVAATLILKKIWGPWLEEGPSDDDNIGVVPNNALVLGPAPEGCASPPTVSVSVFLEEVIVLDGRLWIFASSCLFCDTAY
jgi:hypothetical protein